MKSRPWTWWQKYLLTEFYPDWPTTWLLPHLGHSLAEIKIKVANMGLRKSSAYHENVALDRFEHDGVRRINGSFPPGHRPANKGLRRPGWSPGRMAETQFKKGSMSGPAQHNYVPIGSTRIVYGNLERKVTDDPTLYPARRWRPVHRMVWEAANGPVPRGHVVVFRPGMHTTVEADITLDRVECITRRQLLQRNHIKRYPPELREVMRLKGRVTRQLNKRGKNHEKQDR